MGHGGSDNSRIKKLCFRKTVPGRERWDGIAAMDETAAEDLQWGSSQEDSCWDETEMLHR